MTEHTGPAGTSSLSADVPLNWAVLQTWMDEQSLGSGLIEEVAAIGGGTQNIMASFRRGDDRFVLRRGPLHLRPRSNAVMLREMWLLESLAQTTVPHPRLVASCRDADVLDGAAFYLMEPVDGFNASVGLPAKWLDDPAVRHAMGLGLIEALATLACVDYRAVGLDDFGKPEGFLERQVERWMGELESYASFAGYDRAGLGSVEDLASWLELNRPAAGPPGILHGDYHVANVMFSPHEPRVAAIVDWEMSTIGDPALDIGAVLALWPAVDGEPDLLNSAYSRAGGLPNERELLRCYTERTGRDLSAIDWYVALAAFKLAIILDGSFARAGAGKADPATGDRLHGIARQLVGRARARMRR